MTLQHYVNCNPNINEQITICLLHVKESHFRMQLEYVQEAAVDMTPEQLEVMWSHFRVLDSERMHFHKPPSTWKPPDVRDMNDDELNAYWSGFRQIMQAASGQSGESESMIVPAKASDENVSTSSHPKRVRIRGKQPAKDVVAEIVAKNVKKRPKGRPRGSNNKYKQDKLKTARTGKSDSVSIWKKVQLFKEP